MQSGIESRFPIQSSWMNVLDAQRQAMLDLLRRAIGYPSISGDEREFVLFIAQWAREQGFLAECWETDETQLAAYPQSKLRHLPLAGRPTLVIRFPGQGEGQSLLFNAHSDVVAPGEPTAWRYGPWSGADADGRVYGRGAADSKGPLISALWAMLTLRLVMPAGLKGDLLLELIPGEEDCVGLGTLTSVVRKIKADAVIILEPTRCVPCCASRGGCRFEVVCHGRAVHGTLKWLGVDAIEMMRQVLTALAEMERRWNDRQADPLFSEYPIARPITVDAVHGGRWQGMVCDDCRCAGYLELLPADDLEQWKERFERELRDAMHVVLPAQSGGVTVNFSEEYHGHRTAPQEPLCDLASRVAEEWMPLPPNPETGLSLSACNSGCEAGLRATLQHLPTLVWGPGDLAQAHANDEFIEFAEVHRAARMFTSLAAQWTAEEGKDHDPGNRY